jgi:hypothetical protein
MTQQEKLKILSKAKNYIGRYTASQVDELYLTVKEFELIFKMYPHGIMSSRVAENIKIQLDNQKSKYSY